MLLLTDVQQASLAVQFTDKAGNIAPVAGVPAWSVSDATVLAITPSADGMSAEIIALGPLGAGQVNVSANNADGTTVAGTLDVQVAASDAVSANITAGAPEPKP